MLQAMGWQEGKGLGRHQQGITAPISVRRFFFIIIIKLPSLPMSLFFFTDKLIRTVTSGAPVSSLSPPITVFVLPLQASLRTKGTGLGIKGSSYELSPSDTYKDAVRKAMFARFTELE